MVTNATACASSYRTQAPPDMQSAECPYCLSITLGYWHGDDESLSDISSLKQELFHGVCEQCEHASTDSTLILCGWCQHQRLYHIFVCLGRAPSSLTGFRVDPARQLSLNCDYCRLLQQLDARSDTSTNYIGESRSGFNVRFPEGSVGEPHLIGVRPTAFYVHSPALQLRSAETVDWITHSEVHVGSPEAHRYGLVRKVNWELSRQWLSTVLISKPESAESRRGPVRSLIDVRVIDTSRSCIVRLPQDAEYVTLSYVVC
ncbi:uncharacterized protein CC84DRAFT_756521 [Paraphaeosphaeria sporulosa]|uniref:Uncharacterized protein n=1 Tax=Paraphaeosphaeria sporulosa TaxID=1460663 RepID=A0A177CH51_9PLEO|nr:uncharacterized protein CC84DRAFT_756521 [Paraphaeosphaeria sporulosa]OAG06272.1 hypothetical protein CC84DRAFT_756521 [Paraphaeosphaeria sporulosa]